MAQVSTPVDDSGNGADLSDTRLDHLLTRLRGARVGGTFWAPPPPFAATVVLRPRSAGAAIEMAARARAGGPDDAILALLPRAPWAARARRGLAARGVVATIGDVDPWAVLRPGMRLHAHLDDEFALLAQVAGATLVRADGGATPSVAAARTALRCALLARATYRDPFSGRNTSAEAVVDLLAEWRRMFDANRGIAVATGIAWWKRDSARRFLWDGTGKTVVFARSTRAALSAARQGGGAIAMWPSRAPRGLVESAASHKVPLMRIEDGFIRSAGLGSDLLPPLSVVLDARGIHYDPACPSTLEHLLETTRFSPELLDRAEALRQAIVRGGVSKYGRVGVGLAPPPRGGRRVVLVAGQVSDDQSVRLGGAGVRGVLDLLARVRAAEPDAELWFRPHPDVDAGHRNGAVADAAALRHADRVVRGGAIADLLDRVDAVHVLTSLTGFEALLRGIAVTTHGHPFYAGWGLTRDLAPALARRTRRPSLGQLVAAALILYPRYLDPVTRLPCPPEVVVRRLATASARDRVTWLTRARRWQGRARRVLRQEGVA